MNFLQSLIPEGSLNQEKSNLFQQNSRSISLGVKVRTNSEML